MRHRLISLICTLTLAILSASAFTVDGLNYRLTDPVTGSSANYATVTGSASKSITRVVIPPTVTYGGKTYEVRLVTHRAFSDCPNLREVVFEDSEVAIGATYSSGVSFTSAPDPGRPFDGCPVEKIYLGRQNYFGDASTIRDDYMVLSSTAASVDLTISGSTKYIIPGRFGAFDLNLTSLTLGGAVTYIGKSAFENRTTLKNLTIETIATSFSYGDSDCFTGCTLDSLILKSGIRGLPFSKVDNLLIKNSVNSISSQIFSSATTIGSAKIEDGGTQLQVSSDYPNSIFKNTAIDSLYWGRSVNNPTTITYSANITNVEFGPNVTAIPGAFSSHTELKTVKMSEKAKSIAYSAFKDCTGLTEVVFPDSLESLSNLAFKGCTNLSKADLPGSLKTIGSSAFASTGLTRLSIPASVNSINAYAFGSCESLKTVRMEDSAFLSTPGSGNIFGGCNIDSLYWGSYVDYPSYITQSASIANVEFGPNVTAIPAAFSGHTELKTVKMSDKAKSIASSAFNGCTGLTEVVFPDSIKSIGSSAFENCTALTEVFFSNNLENIDRSAFKGCTNLSKADLPGSLKTIGSSAFASTGLTRLSIPASVNSINAYAFGSCESLKTVRMEDSAFLSTLGSGHIFGGCNIDSLYWGSYVDYPSYITASASITNVEFGPNVTAIPAAFSGHTELKTVKISAKAKSIASSAFKDCTGLTEITSGAKEPPTVGNQAFASGIYPTAMVYVQPGCRKKYARADVWKEFSNIVSLGGFKISAEFDSSKGSVTLNGQDAAEITLDEDEPLTIRIVPVEGYEIGSVLINGEDFSGELVNGELTYGEITEDMNITVTFNIIHLNLTARTSVGGTILLNEATAETRTIAYGSSLNITLQPERGYSVASLNVNGEDVTGRLVDNSYGIEAVTEDLVIEAVFERILLNVAVSCQSPYGSIEVEGTTDGKIAFGSPLTVIIRPTNEGCYLTSLRVNGNDETPMVSDNRYVIAAIEENSEITAEFDIARYSIGYSYDATMGSVTADVRATDANTVVAEYGSSVTFNIEAYEGYELKSVTIDGNDISDQVSADGKLEIADIKADHQIEVIFAIKKIRLSIAGLEGGLVSMLHNYGDDAMIEVSPYDTWKFHSLTVNGEVYTELTDDIFTLENMTEDKELNIVFVNEGLVPIEATYASNAIRVSVDGHTIIVEGAPEEEIVRVFDAAGRLFYEGTDRRITMQTDGVYIVTLASHAYKVAIR